MPPEYRVILQARRLIEQHPQRERGGVGKGRQIVRERIVECDPTALREQQQRRRRKLLRERSDREARLDRHRNVPLHVGQSERRGVR
jgi:hypothetical protein